MFAVLPAFPDRTGIARSTATSHLNLLVDGGLLVEERHGRHRYLRVADHRVIELIESLAALAPQQPARPRSLSASSRRQALARARLCYDHLAGSVAELGITVPPPGSRRPPVRACLDWTERRPHLGGAVGAALCAHALAVGWVTRIGTTRTLAVTPAGRQALDDHLDVQAVTL
ncbi:ArsR/SmtB family transcription factor [Embleya sp. NPDC055664]